MAPRRSASPARLTVSAGATPARASPRLAQKKALSTPVWGEYVPHAHVSAKNIGNAVLTAVVLLPSFFCVAYLYTTCSATRPVGSACELAIDRPILFANVLFFANVTVAFWLIGLAQRSFWLIDPYWTLLPPLLGHLYQLHPRASYAPARSAIVLGLLWAWAARLTHSYFRREEWKFGQREDWRYSKMARDFPRYWWLLSFFAVGLAQQPMLVGISLPAYTAHFVAAPLSWPDALAACGCVAGLATAWRADNELRRYMLATPRPAPVLDSGIWRYSRHPNYFGEQLWWWSFAGFAVGLGEWWMIAGTAFNSVVLATVTVMTEQRMLKNWEASRADKYREYMRTTSVLIPWFKFGKKKSRATPPRLSWVPSAGFE